MSRALEQAIDKQVGKLIISHPEQARPSRFWGLQGTSTTQPRH